MAEPKVICIIKSGNFAYFVYDTIKNIQKIFTGINPTPVVVDVVNTTLYYVTVEIIPTEGVQVIKDKEQSSADKLNLFRIPTNDIDYRVMIARITEIMNKLELDIAIKIVKDIANIIIYGPDQVKWQKNGGKKRNLSSRKTSSSRRRRSTKRRTTSRKQQKRRRGSRRAH